MNYMMESLYSSSLYEVIISDERETERIFFITSNLSEALKLLGLEYSSNHEIDNIKRISLGGDKFMAIEND